MNNKMTVVHVGAANEPYIDKSKEYHFFDIRTDELLPYADIENVSYYNTGLYSETCIKKVYLTRKGTCSSLYEPNMEELSKHLEDPSRFSVVNTIEVEVKRMDSILPSDLTIDLLKIDTQGSELDVLKGAGDLLNNTSYIECEVEFVPLYKDQPLFQDIEDYLKSYNFKLAKFIRKVKWASDTIVFGDALFEKKL